MKKRTLRYEQIQNTYQPKRCVYNNCVLINFRCIEFISCKIFNTVTFLTVSFVCFLQTGLWCQSQYPVGLFSSWLLWPALCSLELCLFQVKSRKDKSSLSTFNDSFIYIEIDISVYFICFFLEYLSGFFLRLQRYICLVFYVLFKNLLRSNNCKRQKDYKYCWIWVN